MVSPGNRKMDERYPGPEGGTEQPGQIAARIMIHIYKRGMTTTSGGNLSVSDSSGNIRITPAGTDKGSLRPEDIVCVSSEGVVSGNLKPSSEYPLHRAIYKARPDLKALIHAHPPVLTSFSVVHRIPDTAVLRNAFQICGKVGYAGYELSGSERLGETVAAEFRKGHNAVIMENHAVVVGGRDLTEALVRLETLENCAATIQTAGFIGEVTTLGEGQLKGMPGTGKPDLLHSFGSDRALSDEPAESDRTDNDESVAGEICVIVRRACERGLMYGSSGTISLRHPGNGFMITPEGTLLWDVSSEDIILVTDSTLISGQERGGPGWIHREIYRRFPGIGAVIEAQPPYLMAFAVTGTEPDVRTIPESWLFLQELPIVPFGAQIHGRNDIHDKISGGAPAVLIRNDSVLVTGANLLQAFDRLEVAEMTARSLILGKTLGTVAPISRENIEELRETFISKK